MSTHAAKAKAPRRRGLKGAGNDGPKKAINERAQKHRSAFLAYFMPGEAVTFARGRSLKWTRTNVSRGEKVRKKGEGYEELLASYRKNNRFAEAERDIEVWLDNIEQTDFLPIAAKAEVASAEEERPAVKPNANAETVLGLYHKVAAGTSGVFVLAYIAPASTKEAGKRPLRVQRFRINDAGGMAAEARSRGTCENVYFGPALMRTDLAKGKRGEEGDITAVLAIVLEEDGDTGKLVSLPCGIAPTFEIETSHVPTLNRHIHFVFERPLAPQDAKALAILAHGKCGGDSGGKDICHVWRVPETLNFPDWRKLARGRPATPQPVRLIGGTGEPISVETFRAALEAMPDLHPDLKRGEIADWQEGGSKDRAAIIERLKPRLISKIQEEGKDRSAHCFSVLMALFDANLIDDEVLIVSAGAPFARKFDERGDLKEEIGRSRTRWNAQKQISDRNASSGDEKETQAARLRSAGAYEAKDDGLFWTKETRDGDVRQRLTNFCAWIVGERIEDDGAERRSCLDIEAEIHGRTTRFTVAASHFSSMNWALENIGADAVVEPGFGSRDRARAAIQYLSGRTPRHYTYAHCGWRQIEGQGWIYLHASGALGANGALSGIDVAMPGALAHYALPMASTSEELATAVRSSLALLELAPDRISVPLLGATYRAALGNADFSPHLSGFTGTGKSEIAALMQQHFGAEMHAKRLPGSWSSTANQLEGLAFSAKDALFVIDDFVPQGSVIDRARLNQAADRVLRGVGNSAGRGRAGPDGKPRPTKPPRALVISTGEEIPGGQSLRARLLVIEVTKGAIGHGDLRKLLPHQEAAISGKYAQAMAGFIQWLALDLDERRREFYEESKTRRHQMVATASHARTGDIGAQLATSWRFITRFAVECGAISEEEALRYLDRADKAIALVVSEQGDIQSTVDPIERFRALLNGVVASGRAHIASREGGEPASPEAYGWRKLASVWQPQGRLIGWEDGSGGLFLEPESSYTAVQEMGNANGEGVGISSATLRKRLHERGMLLSTETDKNKVRLTVRQTIGGKRRQVVHITNLLYVPEIGAPCAPVAPVGDNIALNQALSRENISKRSAPAKEESAPCAPVNGAVNGLAHTVAHKKCATDNTCATNVDAQCIEFAKENIPSAHVANMAHVSEDIGKGVANDFEAKVKRSVRL